MVAYLADECVAGPLVRALIEAGRDVLRSSEVIAGAGDAEVLAPVSCLRIAFTFSGTVARQFGD